MKQLKENYMIQEAKLVALQYYLDRAFDGKLQIYAANEVDFEIVGSITMCVQQMLEELKVPLHSVFKNDAVATAEEQIQLDFCYIQSLYKNNLRMKLTGGGYDREKLFEWSGKYLDDVLAAIFVRAAVYEQKLNVSTTTINDEMELVFFIEEALQEDFPNFDEQVFIEIVGIFVEKRCKQCGKMHNSKRQCGSLNLKYDTSRM